MELKKTDKKIKCDCLGCKNLSEYSFNFKKTMFVNSMFICKQCLTKMYELAAKEITPQSIKNVYKKTNEIKEK